MGQWGEPQTATVSVEGQDVVVTFVPHLPGPPFTPAAPGTLADEWCITDIQPSRAFINPDVQEIIAEIRAGLMALPS